MTQPRTGPVTALVTGGGSGIGAGIAARLRADGLRVLTVDVDPGEGVDVVADVADPAGMSGVRAAVGPVGVVVNAAFVLGPRGALVDVEDEDWARTIEVGLSGTFHVCRAFLADMVEAGWGRVVNIAGAAAAEGTAGPAVDSAAAAGAIGLTTALARELSGTGVLVNAVVPAPRVDEVAELVAWLASERCSFSTGVVYDLSAGSAGT